MRQHPKAESGQHLHKMGLETLSAAQAVSGEIRVAAALLVSVLKWSETGCLRQWPGQDHHFFILYPQALGC